MNNPTNKDVHRFAINIIYLLHSEGFYVNSFEEAFCCIQGIMDKQVTEEINEAMKEYSCQSCHHISGSKNLGRVN